MNEKSLFESKVALVTGGSRGIGLAIAKELLLKRLKVVIVGRSSSALSEACDVLSALVPTTVNAACIESVKADVSDPSQAERAIDYTVKKFGGLDILINNAGVSRFRELADLSISDWREMLGTNLDGAFFCCRAALPVLRSRGQGWIINISSLAGSNPFVGGTAYCASKAGLNAMTEALMQEVRYENIRVSLVAPGSVDTKFVDSNSSELGDWKLSTDDVAKVVIDLLGHDSRSLPSRIEIRPSRPKRK